MIINPKDIRDAAVRIAPHIHRTPVLSSQSINQMAGCSIFFKCENFQKVGAFKMRGASNAVMQLSEEQLSKGVATHSSGNHAAALARAAQAKRIKAYIVMPSNAPEIKKKAVAGYGAEIIPCEPTLTAREQTLAEVVARTGATFIPPYNSYEVILGQATCALELIEQTKPLDVILAPIGGGGLMAGTCLSTHFFSPKTLLVGAEPEGANDAFQSLQSGKIIPMTHPDTIADGLRTSLGEKTFPILQKHLQRIITVNDKEIVQAMRLIWERMKIIIEPSCAVPLAAVLKEKKAFEAQRVGIILTGGNVDLESLPFGKYGD
jgi:threonine dehydratase